MERELTQKMIFLFCTEGCAPCEGMHGMLEKKVEKHDGVHLEKLMADDGERGSKVATALGIRSTPTVVFVEHWVGRRGDDLYGKQIDSFIGNRKG